MSGGYFNYRDSSLKYDIFGYGNTCTNVFEDREISLLIYDIFDLIHDFDWYQSGDTCEETWLKKKREFKKKWLYKNSCQARTKEIIDTSIKELKDELYKTYLSEEYDAFADGDMNDKTD